MLYIDSRPYIISVIALYLINEPSSAGIIRIKTRDAQALDNFDEPWLVPLIRALPYLPSYGLKSFGLNEMANIVMACIVMDFDEPWLVPLIRGLPYLQSYGLQKFWPTLQWHV